MPWTQKQVRFLESSGSPLTPAQKSKMNSELHSDPSLGHKKKGSEAMAKEAGETKHNLKGMRIEIHRGKDGEVTGHTVHHEFEPKSTKSGAFMERPPEASYPFGAGSGKEVGAHVAKHLGGGSAEAGRKEPVEAKQDKEPEGEVQEEEEGGY